MPFCPNCGSYVSPGTNICSCGTTLGYSSEPEIRETESDRQRKQKENMILERCRHARSLMDDGRYLEAIECYERIRETYPHWHCSNTNRAKAYFYAGRYEEAIAIFNEAKLPGRKIDNIIPLSWIGRALTELDRFDEAIATYHEAIGIIDEDYERSVDFFTNNHLEYGSAESACASSLEDKNERTSWMYEEIAITYNRKGNHFQDFESYGKALDYIEEAIRLDGDMDDWNVKAIVLENIGRYEESKRCYDRALRLERDNTVIENKARMIRRWCQSIYDECGNLNQALDLISEAIEELSAIKTDENILRYEWLKEDIEGRIELNSQIPILKDIGRRDLITIAGTQFHGNHEFREGMKLKLVREPENDHDHDAIAVYFKANKVGYVANSQRTNCRFTAMASEIDVSKGSHALYVMNYNGMFHIARLIR